ncbi:dermonecrotic toxin domain-containing protein [Pseudomonas sp. NPDC089743]|uniref:dermonecrotic toxin domain-containing protein n=1 Tax=Pseudomonas sp. NPDC089743 TaxID=3364471 RepID=UPI0037FA32F4
MAVSPSNITYRQLVASRFAERPTLRRLLADEGFSVLADRYPWIVRNYPHLESLERFTVLRAEPSLPPEQPLVPLLLEHYLSGRPMDLGAGDQLSIAPPQPFYPQEQGANPADQPRITLDMAMLNRDFDTVLGALGDAFEQAQISFWAGTAGAYERSNLRWLAHVLKASLLNNVERQGLNATARARLYRLLSNGTNTPVVSALQISLGLPGNILSFTLPDFVLFWPDLVLWCSPSGRVRSYRDATTFANALRDQLAQTYRFDTLRWAQRPLPGDPFEHQATAMLNGIVERLGLLRVAPISSVEALEHTLDTVTNPAAGISGQPVVDQDQPAIALPGWLASAEASDRLLYSAALLQLGARQAQAGSKGSLDDVETLHAYARRRLREQMQLDHPDQPLPDPNALMIAISVVVPVSSTGPAQLPYLKSMSLTELAIERLHTASNEVASGLTYQGRIPEQAWITLDYVQALIAAVDIGGQYPLHVAAQLQAFEHDPGQVQRFAQEWRSNLAFSALKAKIAGQLGETAYRAIAEFCLGKALPSTPLTVSALLLRPFAGARKGDTVHGMFLLHVQASASYVLYRPFFAQRPLMEQASLDALMALIRTDVQLQQDVLDWIDDENRPVYQHGGFIRPHLHPGLSSLAHWLGGGTAWTDDALESLRTPVTLMHEPWRGDLDIKVHNARVQALLLLASRQAVSNSQQRWALARQLGWMLFNATTPLLRGPAAVVAWVVAAVAALKDDLSALTQGTPEEKALAVTDLLANVAMLLIHDVGSVTPEPPAARLQGPLPWLEGLEARPAAAAPWREAPDEGAWQSPVQPQRHVALLNWGDNQRLGNLPAPTRHALGQLQANISLDGLKVQRQGRLRGLYTLDDRYFVNLHGAAYEVQESETGLRIIGPPQNMDEWQSRWGGNPDGYHIVGRQRRYGPWLTRWNDTWVLDLALAGGMPRTRQQVVAQNQQQFDSLNQAVATHHAALKKIKPLLESNQRLMADYDADANAFGHALARAGGPAAMDEQLQQRNQALTARRQALMPQIRTISLCLEKQASLLQTSASLLRQLIEPRFARLDRHGSARRSLGVLCETFVENDILLLRRLLEQTDHNSIEQRSVGLSKLPVTDEQIQRHVSLRQAMQDTLGIVNRLLTVSERLDNLLPQILDDPLITFQNKDKKARIEEAVALRPYSTLIIRAQKLSDMANLLLDKTRLTEQAAVDLLPLQQALDSKQFSQTIWTHDGIATANLPQEEQAGLLGDALREYQTTLGKAQYLQSFDHPAIDQAMLQGYIEELSTLVHITEAQLASALVNVDSGASPAPAPVLHRVHPRKNTVIRTAQGRRLLVDRAQGSNRAVQHDPVTQQPASTFEQRDGEWYELPPEQPSVALNTSELRQRATSLLASRDERIAKAARHINEPNALSNLMDWHIEDMLEIAVKLKAIKGDPRLAALSSELQEAITYVRAEKQRLLTQSYLTTQHPDAAALRYLHERQRLQITPTVARKPTRRASDFLDVYEIRDTHAPAKVLWEAHFHYRSQQASARDFAKGHLKFWEPRSLEREEQLKHATTAERIKIYRGDLKLEDVVGIVPFPAD